MSRPARARIWFAAIGVLGAAAIAIVASGVVSAPGAGDNNVPGVPLPASPVAGALDDHTDFDDVYAVPLAFNQKLEVTMTGQDGARFDVWLWRPSTTSVLADSPHSRVVQSSQNPTSSAEHFWYPVRAAGTHYLHVFNPLDGAGTSAGTYELNYTITSLPAPTIEIKAPMSIGWGKTASITGVATLDGQPLAGARVLVQSKAAGSKSWKDLNFDSAAYAPRTVTTPAGAYAYQVKPTLKTQYRAVVWPSEVYGWRFGSATTITPRVRLDSPHVPSSVKRNARFTAYGFVAPRHAAKAKTVTLTFKKGSRVVRVKAVNSNHSSRKWGRSSKYVATVKLPARGKWSVVATAPADSLHAATSSKPRYITVR